MDKKSQHDRNRQGELLQSRTKGYRVEQTGRAGKSLFCQRVYKNTAQHRLRLRI